MPSYDINRIKEIIPHRFPFLLVDRILSLEDKRCVGLKNFTANEPFSQEYFGGLYPMQGVLVVEAMAQVAAFLMLSRMENHEGLALFATIERVRFRRPALPGDQLIIEVDILRERSKTAHFSGRCVIDGKVSCEAKFACMMVSRNSSAEQEEKT
jgi:3-hydroxyacyl-[acyl-carrier-protein] dehydratase